MKINKLGVTGRSLVLSLVFTAGLTSGCAVTTSTSPSRPHETEPRQPYYVSVKYHKKVNLHDDKFVEVNVDDNLVKELHFDASSNYAIVKLKHTYYHYCGIPASVVSSWDAVKNQSSYYRTKIQGRYDCRIYPIPSYD